MTAYNARLTIVFTLVFLAFTGILFSQAKADHNANPKCTSVKEDIEHLEKILLSRSSVGKVWVYSDKGYAISFAASPMFKAGTIIMSFYDDKGCLMRHPGTGAVRTTLPVTDKIKAYIAKSKLFWSNTDKVLLTSAGLPI